MSQRRDLDAASTSSYANGVTSTVTVPTTMSYLPQTVVLCELRHAAFEASMPTGPSDSGLVSKWRPKYRMKTGCVALVLCLNISVDPPDVIKISPCARMECWTVEELEGDEGEIPSTINSLTLLCFPKLTKLSICKCDGLEYIFPTSLAPQGLQGLTLHIMSCPQLKQVFRVGNDSLLQHQQSLRSLSFFLVSYCPQLTDSIVHFETEEARIEGYPAVCPELDLVEEDDQLTHEISLQDEIDPKITIDIFKPDPQYLENEK